MKYSYPFLCLFLLLMKPGGLLTAQRRNDSTVKVQRYNVSRLPSSQNRRDSVPTSKAPPHRQPATENQTDETQPHRPYVAIDSNKPVPVETPTYIRSVLRLQNIYVNNDAIALMQLLNPQLANQQTVMSDTKLVLPEFPPPDSRNNKAVNRQFRIDVDPDDQVNNQFARTAATTDSLVNIFKATNFDIDDARDRKYVANLKNILTKLVDINNRAIKRIRHTSRATVGTLTAETNALNNVLAKSTADATITGDNLQHLYALLVDMNILLSGITDKKLIIPIQNGQTSNLTNSTFSYVSFHSEMIPPAAESISSSDDDPRKFNIYIFRKSLAQNGKKNPELKTFSISYCIPALANEETAWNTLPEPASTVHCSFPPARFNFTITDLDTNDVYSATEDLFDAQKDPNEKWTILNLIDPHPTYRLIFLIP